MKKMRKANRILLNKIKRLNAMRIDYARLCAEEELRIKGYVEGSCASPCPPHISALVSALKKQRYAIRTLEDENKGLVNANKRIFAKLVEFEISTY